MIKQIAKTNGEFTTWFTFFLGCELIKILRKSKEQFDLVINCSFGKLFVIFWTFDYFIHFNLINYLLIYLISIKIDRIYTIDFNSWLLYGSFLMCTHEENFNLFHDVFFNLCRELVLHGDVGFAAVLFEELREDGEECRKEIIIDFLYFDLWLNFYFLVILKLLV